MTRKKVPSTRTIADPLAELRAFVSQYPTQKAAARALGVGEVFLHDMLTERRDISPRILDALGLERAVVVKA